MSASFRVLDGGARCEVEHNGKTLTLKAQAGTVYTEADEERIVSAAVRYMATAQTDAPNESIKRWAPFGREFIIRVDHSEPAWRWPRVLVNRRERWIGAGWRLTLVQVFMPKRRAS